MSYANEPAQLPLPGQHIAIVGPTGSGKTTLAVQLAQRLNIPHIELDALHWEPNWTEAPIEVFHARVRAALSGPAWIVDGNYSKAREIVWDRIDTVVWLDYRLSLCLWQLSRRTFHRVVTRQELWNGNRESWRKVLSKDSILLWSLRSYPRLRERYTRLLGLPEYQHLIAVHLTSPRMTARWLASVPPCSAPA